MMHADETPVHIVGRRAVVPVPPSEGSERLRWFADFESAVGVDLLATGARMRAHGLPMLEVIDEIANQRDWLIARIQAVADHYSTTLLTLGAAA